MENRIEKRLKELEKREEKALITYMTAGLPDMEKCKEIIKTQENAGTDIIELGIPFSDPVADGVTIQEASYRAIQKGVTLTKVFEMVRELREEDCQIPLVFMMYYNTILYYGVKEFVQSCAEIGIDGVIIPDLPLEEQTDLTMSIKEIDNAPILIQLVSPVSKQRIAKITENARGFIYCVSSMGVTGQAAEFHRDVERYLEEVKKYADIPVMMGFGIRTAKDIERMKYRVDGAVVGSHFIKLMENNSYNLEVIGQYIQQFKKEMNEKKEISA